MDRKLKSVIIILLEQPAPSNAGLRLMSKKELVA